jgi:hypothetical protein
MEEEKKEQEEVVVTSVTCRGQTFRVGDIFFDRYNSFCHPRADPRRLTCTILSFFKKHDEWRCQMEDLTSERHTFDQAVVRLCVRLEQKLDERVPVPSQ